MQVIKFGLLASTFLADRLLRLSDFAVATLSFLSVAMVVALGLAVLQKPFNAKVVDNLVVVEDKAEKLVQILSKAGFATDRVIGEVTIGFNANTEVKRVISYLYLP